MEEIKTIQYGASYFNSRPDSSPLPDMSESSLNFKARIDMKISSDIIERAI